MTKLHRYTTLEDLADALVPLLNERLNDGKPAPDEPDSWPEPAPDEPGSTDETDPWADEPPARETRSPSRSAPHGGSSSRQPASRSRQQSKPARGSSNAKQDWPVSGTETDRFDRTWTFGDADAPQCHHGHDAARVEGVSQQGRDYEVWACPLGFGKNYKQKCDLWDYV